MHTMEEFLSLIFNPGECATYGSHPNAAGVFSAPLETDLFFSINCLYPDRETNPTQEWHDARRPRRADKNVASYRTFLLELDAMPLDEQIAYVNSVVPYSTCVYSGGKSHHFLIVLEEPLADYGQYMDISRRLHKLVSKADPTTKNPSRLSRLPFRRRLDTGKDQTLVALNGRIKLADLERLLPPPIKRIERTQGEVVAYITPLLLRATFEPDEVMVEMNIHGRNSFFYWMHNRFQDLNLTADRREYFVNTAYQNLRDKDGFSIDEAYAAARVRGN